MFRRGGKKKRNYGGRDKPRATWQTFSGWSRGERPWYSGYIGNNKPLRGGAALAHWVLRRGKQDFEKLGKAALRNDGLVKGWFYGRVFKRYFSVDGRSYVVFQFFGYFYARELIDTSPRARNKAKNWFADEDFAPTSRMGGGPNSGGKNGR